MSDTRYFHLNRIKAIINRANEHIEELEREVKLLEKTLQLHDSIDKRNQKVFDDE